MSKERFWYKQEVTCTNCGRSQKFTIPKGTSVTDYLLSPGVICKNCGCNPLHQSVSSQHDK